MVGVWGDVWGATWADVWGLAGAALAPAPSDSIGSMATLQPRRKVRRVLIDPPPFADPLQQARDQALRRDAEEEELLLSIGVL